MTRDERHILIGVSACLLGEKVRYDGSHRMSQVVVDLFNGRFKPLLVCPELETGMTVPREKVGLFGSPDAPRMIGLETGRDWTQRMTQYAAAKIGQSDVRSVSGFILRSRSPSCGPGSVKLFDSAGNVTRTGRGLFATVLGEAHPSLPVVDETSLEQSAVREEFIQRVLDFSRPNGE
jgi:uncharacterized protein YbbK (DUF523 family)